MKTHLIVTTIAVTLATLANTVWTTKDAVQNINNAK
jgi:hypothetical protein